MPTGWRCGSCSSAACTNWVTRKAPASHFEFRWAEGHTDRLANAAAELVRLNVDVLVTAGTPAAAAASRATPDIPIVMATGVGLGTQLTEGADAAQRQRHRHQRSAAGRQRRAAATAPRSGAGRDRSRSGGSRQSVVALALRETQAAAQPLGIAVKDYWIATAGEFGAALASMRRDGVGGCVVAPGALFFAERKALAALAIEHRLATITARREYAEAGCLMAYGAPIRDNYRQAADYVDRILARRQTRRLAGRPAGGIRFRGQSENRRGAGPRAAAGAARPRAADPVISRACCSARRNRRRSCGSAGRGRWRRPRVSAPTLTW